MREAKKPFLSLGVPIATPNANAAYNNAITIGIFIRRLLKLMKKIAQQTDEARLSGIRHPPTAYPSRWAVKIARTRKEDVMNRALCVIAVCLGVLGYALAQSSEEVSAGALAGELKSIMEARLAGFQTEDADAIRKVSHRDSRGYEGLTPERMKIYFKYQDLTYKITYFKYIGMDGGYAVARAKEEIAGGKGRGAALNGEFEFIYVFRKEREQWKFWMKSLL